VLKNKKIELGSSSEGYGSRRLSLADCGAHTHVYSGRERRTFRGVFKQYFTPSRSGPSAQAQRPWATAGQDAVPPAAFTPIGDAARSGRAGLPMPK
jgi:hypothetical protein